MNSQIYKLNFLTGVHFGKNDLTDADIAFCADTLFSALALEALPMGQDIFREFYESVEKGDLLLSDGMPYIGEELYVPKPFLYIQREKSDMGSRQKKLAKKLKYIPVRRLSEYFDGKLNLEQESEKLGSLGSRTEKVSAAVSGLEETMPYRVGVYSFRQGNGLFFCIRYSDSRKRELLESLLLALSFSGIGGERSSGLGRFSVKNVPAPLDLTARLEGKYGHYMALSACMAREEELEEVTKHGCYQMKKRSGFIDSGVKGEDGYRKQDRYVFAAGSCFEKKFDGLIFDVSQNGVHPVYRYAKAMWMGVIYERIRENLPYRIRDTESTFYRGRM